MPTTPAIMVETRRVATVRIARPQKRNALRPRDVIELIDVLLAMDRDAAVRCVLLGGEGGWLCAGGDLTEDVAVTPQDAEAQQREYQRLLRTVLGLRVPVVVVLEGAAVGAGAALALAADVCVGATGSRIMVPWISRGLVPDTGVAFLLARQLGPARAKACLLTGGAISAEQAVDWGLIVETADDAWTAAELWAERLAAGPPVATMLTKRLVNSAALGDLDAYLDLERSSVSAALGTTEPAEGIAAFVERRLPDFDEGARQ